MDAITPAEPPPIAAGSLHTVPSTAAAPHTVPEITPLEHVEAPKIRTKLRLYAILAALYIAVFVAALDQTVVAICVPTISAQLHSASGYVWIGGAYLVASAATGPIWSKCSDIWGRKPVLLTSIVAFAASSILVALSQNMTSIVAGRSLQGAASGGLIQLNAIIISDLFSVRKRSLYLGYVGFVWALAGSAGPLVGGALTEYASWRWCFWINIPICALSFGLIFLFLDVHNPRTKMSDGIKALDWIGTLSILSVTLMLLLGLDLGGAIAPWNSPKVICLIVFGTAMIGFFLFTEKRLATYPLMPLSVFRDRSNNAVFIITFMHGMVLIGLEYYLPLYFQSVWQATPFKSGLLMLPLLVVQSAVEIMAGTLIDRTGRYRETIWAGTVLMTLGTGLYIIFGTHTSLATVIGLEIVGALGPALLFQGPIVAIQNTVRQSDAAAATASWGFLRSVAMSLSVVVGGVVFQNSMDARSGALAATGLDQSTLDALSGAQAAANVGIAKSIKDPSQHQAILESFAWSMRNMFIMYTALAAVAMAASVFIRHSVLKTEHSETITGIDQLKKAADPSRQEGN